MHHSRNSYVSLVAAAIFALAGLVPAAPAFAAPYGPASAGKAGTQVELARRGFYGRGYGYGPRYGYWRGRRGPGWVGPAIVGGVAALIIGGSIAAARANHYDRWEMCANEFRSFDPRDGSIQPYDGPRTLCPYLRQ